MPCPLACVPPNTQQQQQQQSGDAHPTVQGHVGSSTAKPDTLQSMTSAAAPPSAIPLTAAAHAGQAAPVATGPSAGPAASATGFGMRPVVARPAAHVMSMPYVVTRNMMAPAHVRPRWRQLSSGLLAGTIRYTRWDALFCSSAVVVSGVMSFWLASVANRRVFTPFNDLSCGVEYLLHATERPRAQSSSVWHAAEPDTTLPLYNSNWVGALGRNCVQQKWTEVQLVRQRSCSDSPCVQHPERPPICDLLPCRGRQSVASLGSLRLCAFG
eukprot:1158598-Pelagomonas_calceolata.AAC.5